MPQKEQWQVSGSAAEVYEAELVPAIFGAWAPVVVDLCDPRPGERVLDLACGTGVVARLAAQRVGPTGRVVGVDPNPGMLAVARAGVAPEPDAAPVEWHQAGAEALPLADAGFDVVCCQLGLQFFVDRPTALREMHRVLAPGGRLALMVWRSIDHSPGFAALLAALERHVGAAAAAVVRAPFSLSDDAELEALIRAAGFRDVAVERRAGTARFPSVEGFVRGYVTGSPLAGHMAQASDAVREALVADVQAALAGYASDSELKFPMAALLASARK